MTTKKTRTQLRGMIAAARVEYHTGDKSRSGRLWQAAVEAAGASGVGRVVGRMWLRLVAAPRLG